MIHALWEAIRWTWRDPDGYGVFSGPLPDIPLLVGAGIALKHRNCHVKTCWRLSRHSVGPYRVCSKHHPSVPDEISSEHVEKAHKESL